MPEQLYEQIEKCKKEWRICFVAALCFGLAAHMYKLLNFIPNWDSLVNFHNNQDTTYLGRCFLHIVCTVGSWYDLPWVNGMLSLLYIGLSAVCICELFMIRTKTALVLTGAMLAVFPTVTSTLAYNYTADGYMAALLCSSLAVLLLIRKKGWKAFWGATLLLTFTLGIYQAYITFAMVLILVYLLDCLVLRKSPMEEIRVHILRCFGVGAVGCILYWIALKLILLATKTELSSYQGIEQAFSLSGINILHSVKACVCDFLTYFFDFSQGISLFTILNILMFVFLLFFFAVAIKTGRVYQEPSRMALTILCLILIPFASYALYFISYLEYHNLMVMCNVMVFILFILLYERIETIRLSLYRLKQWTVLILSTLIIFNFILIANICYQKMYMTYEKSYATVLRIIDRIEQIPGAENCSKLAVIGEMEGNGEVSVTFPPDMTGVSDLSIIWGQDQILAMMKEYFGMEYEAADEQEISMIESEEGFEEMPCWPEQGSVSIMNGTLVLRLSVES